MIFLLANTLACVASAFFLNVKDKSRVSGYYLSILINFTTFLLVRVKVVVRETKYCTHFPCLDIITYCAI